MGSGVRIRFLSFSIFVMARAKGHHHCLMAVAASAEWAIMATSVFRGALYSSVSSLVPRTFRQLLPEAKT